jgi:hypothetical protein
MPNPSASIYERCGLNFPKLPRWFLTWRGEADCPRRRSVSISDRGYALSYQLPGPTPM